MTAIHDALVSSAVWFVGNAATWPFWGDALLFVAAWATIYFLVCLGLFLLRLTFVLIVFVCVALAFLVSAIFSSAAGIVVCAVDAERLKKHRR